MPSNLPRMAIWMDAQGMSALAALAPPYERTRAVRGALDALLTALDAGEPAPLAPALDAAVHARELLTLRAEQATMDAVRRHAGAGRAYPSASALVRAAIWQALDASAQT